MCRFKGHVPAVMQLPGAPAPNTAPRSLHPYQAGVGEQQVATYTELLNTSTAIVQVQREERCMGLHKYNRQPTHQGWYKLLVGRWAIASGFNHSSNLRDHSRRKVTENLLASACFVCFTNREERDGILTSSFRPPDYNAVYHPS